MAQGTAAVSAGQSRTITVAAVQMRCNRGPAENLRTAEALVREAAAAGARLIVLPELFEDVYFCRTQSPAWFAHAHEPCRSTLLAHCSRLAAELGVVLPVSFFEAAGPVHYNSVIVFDVDGSCAGHHRKGHIPQGPGYEEKYYFTPGDTGFRSIATRVGRIGVGICWDQWFPEAARLLALDGAELLLHPTAIGSEPEDPGWDSAPHWRRVMQGHAAANMLPVLAANRTGREGDASRRIDFYGSSFITDGTGALVAELGREEEGCCMARFDLDALAVRRTAWGLFRDRRPDLYGPLLRHGPRADGGA